MNTIWPFSFSGNQNEDRSCGQMVMIAPVLVFSAQKERDYNGELNDGVGVDEKGSGTGSEVLERNGRTGGEIVNVYEIITERITTKLNEGVIPWQKPWNAKNPPQNLTTRRPYHGINLFLLNAARFVSPYWITFKQAEALGGSIKKGSKGMPVVYWNWIEITKDSDDSEKVPFLRYYTVFNADQTEGLDIPKTEELETFHDIAAARAIADGYKNGPSLTTGGSSAYYNRVSDEITIPSTGLFGKPEAYYSVLFHEMTHSTGHESRLNRKTLVDAGVFGSQNYSREELVAEMGAAFLCGFAGIENGTVDNSAAYIKGWLSKLRGDPKLVVLAAAQAQKAANLILGDAAKVLDVGGAKEAVTA